jgi:hypothetical protein
MFELVLPGRRLPVVGVDGAPYGPGPAWHVRPGADAARALRVDDGTPPVHADAEDREPADRRTGRDAYPLRASRPAGGPPSPVLGWPRAVRVRDGPAHRARG